MSNLPATSWQETNLVGRKRELYSSNPFLESDFPDAANRDICPVDLYAPLFIGVPVGVTAPGNGMQEGGK
jgi:hypothetical protein